MGGVNVAVLGASDDPEKYSHKAVMRLKEKGHVVFPVHPSLKEIEGLKVYVSVRETPAIDTVSLYLSAKNSSKIADEIISKKPKRIIFNPGAENPELQSKAEAAGIKTLNACTLVLLSTNQF